MNDYEVIKGVLIHLEYKITKTKQVLRFYSAFNNNCNKIKQRQAYLERLEIKVNENLLKAAKCGINIKQLVVEVEKETKHLRR